MSTVQMVYRRLRDPEATLIWTYPYLKQDHLVSVALTDTRFGERNLTIRPVLTAWCRDQYGRRGDHRAWNYFDLRFAFDDPDKAFAFMMRWKGTTYHRGENP